MNLKPQTLSRATVCTAVALVAVGCLTACSSGSGDAPEVAAPTSSALATNSALASPTPVADEEVLVPLAYELDPERSADAPVLGTVTFDISDSTLAFSGADGSPLGAPMRVSAVGQITEPSSGAVGSLSMDDAGEPQGLFGVVNDSTGAPNFVDVRVSDAPAEPLNDFTGVTVHVPTDAWDSAVVSGWAEGAKSRGDLAFVVQD